MSGDPLPTPRSGAVRRGTPALAVALGTLVANVLVYGVFLVVARALDTDGLGAFSAVANLVVIAGVPALALQLVAARHLARADGPRVVEETGAALRTGGVVGLAGGVLLLAAAPAVTAWLALPGPLPALLLAAVVLPTYLTYAALGCLQGRRRFVAYSVLLVVMSAGRLAAAVLGARLGFDVTGILALTVASVWLASVLALALVRDAVPGVSGPRTTWVGAVLRGSAATSALLVVSNLDTPLARALLPADEAGRYAVLAVFEKAAFWGPAFLAMLLYPRMSTATGRRAAVAAVGATAGIGVLVVAASAALAEPLVGVVGGAAYRGLADLVPLFTAAGAAWSTAQVLVYWRLARGDHRLGWVVWTVTGAVVAVVAVRHDGIAQVITAVLVGGLLVVAWGVGLLLRHGSATRAERRSSVGAGAEDLQPLADAAPSGRRRARSARPRR